YRERMGMGEWTRGLFLLSFSFDAALKNVLTPLLSGGRVILGPVRYGDPGTLVELIEGHGVTALSTTPTMLYPLLERTAGSGYRELSSLECIDVGGEPTQMGRVREFFGSPGCRCHVLHVY